MSTWAFTTTTNGAAYSKDSGGRQIVYKTPITQNVGTNHVLLQFGDDLLKVLTSDTITINGSPFSGTADQLADALDALFPDAGSSASTTIDEVLAEGGVLSANRDIDLGNKQLRIGDLNDVSEGFKFVILNGEIYIQCLGVDKGFKIQGTKFTIGGDTSANNRMEFDTTNGNFEILGGSQSWPSGTIFFRVSDFETEMGDVNNTNNGTKLTVSDDFETMTFKADSGHNFSSGAITVANLAGTGSRAVVASATGVLSAPVSDKRLKKNITKITDEVDVISLLKQDEKSGVFYNWKDEKMGTEREIGMIAQSFEDVPGLTGKMKETGNKYLNYDKLVTILWEQNRELLKRIESLEGN